jgi:hypothetical protein
MIKIKSIKKTRSELITTDILCNLCGKSCKLGNTFDLVNKKGKLIKGKNPVNHVFGGLLEVEVHGVYDSTHLSDMSITRFSICEPCLCSLKKSFKIPAEVKEDFSADFIPENKLKQQYKKHIKEIKNYEKQFLIKNQKKSSISV